MRHAKAATAMALSLVLLGCGRAAPEPPTSLGYPALPATIDVAGATALPATGPVGRGTLIHKVGRDEFLVLADGRILTLPPPPLGEGRQGSTSSTLSPDGRWLGYRRGDFTNDPVYVLRDLTVGDTILTEGVAFMWSANSRFVVLAGTGNGSTLVEPGTGRRSALPVEGRPIALLPDGSPLELGGLPESAKSGRLPTDPGTAFTPASDDACWCPSRYVLSADASTVWVLLRLHGGVVSGTQEKVRDDPARRPLLVAVDRATGRELRRVEVPFDCPSYSCHPAVEVGEALLFLVATVGDTLVTPGDTLVAPGGTRVVALDPRTGQHRTLTTAPGSIVLPGEVSPHNGDG